MNESALKLWDEQQIFEIDLPIWFYLKLRSRKLEKISFNSP
jgi:hypothetical protein